VKKLKYQDYAATVNKNATSTNPAIKTAAYEFYKACYKWMGDALLPLIEDKLKKQQIVSENYIILFHSNFRVG